MCVCIFCTPTAPNASPVSHTISLIGGTDPCFRSSPAHSPFFPLLLSSCRILPGSVYSFLVVRYSCPLSADVLQPFCAHFWMLHLKAASADQSRRPSTCVRVCLIVSDPRDCSLPASSVHGILQTRILECIAVPFSRGSPPPRDPTSSLGSPALVGRFLTTSTTWEAL